MNDPSHPMNSITHRARRVAAAVALSCALAAPAATPAAPAAAAPATDPLVEKVVEAYGGKAALSKVVAVRQRGRLVAVAQGGKQGAIVRLFARPDSLRIEIAYPDGSGEIRVAHQGRATRQGVDVTGSPPGTAMVLQAARIALPFWLAAEPGRARHVGAVERDGGRYEALAVDLPGGLELVAEVEPASGRIVRTVGLMEGPGGGRFEFTNAYSDFRKVNGVLFAMREQNFAGGRQTGETALDEVELLPSPPPGAFAPDSKRL
jgi:hypothetical protein